MNKRDVLKLMGLGLASVPFGAHAQGSRPIRIVVPLPAGSSNDFIARTLGPLMSATLGQPLLIDNKAGGNGTIGTMDVVRAVPDGQTLLLASNSPIAVNSALMRNLPYDPRRDLTAISGAAATNHVLLVSAKSAIKSVSDFIAYARQRPGKVTIGYSTTSVQVQIAALAKLAGIELLAVPYKGTPATVTDVIGGSIDATLTDPGLALAQVKGGHLRALGVGSVKRNPLTPDWPAIAETVPGFDFPSWNALLGPAKLPRDKVDRLHGAMTQALKQPQVVKQFADSGTLPLLMGPDELRAYIDSQAAKWVRLAKELNIQPV